MKYIAIALVIIAFAALAVILILNNHPVWAGVFVLFSSFVGENEREKQ